MRAKRSEAKQSQILDFVTNDEIENVIVIATKCSEAISNSRFRHASINKLLKMNKQYYLYIMTNHYNTVLYTGVTNDLQRRVYEHKSKSIEGFTKKYNITKLVYYEIFEDASTAISREKQIKAGSRQKKIDLVNSLNQEWKDLYDEL
ncbi:GIY-YIG nuclease family protein [Brasilonema sp. UFV-L1]|uniref:GIY-YIG nuclease family protein n=1 Tax=Brasilonema sp. UFV-L1 TaxID=2234130 RepID=UPI002006E53B|nr:GIY-YIG nuclease family protein [Brasilonema sp. UFV-L1]